MPTLSSAGVRLWIDTVDPTVNEDSSNGYEVGNQWLNTNTGQFFDACDVSVGAAIWDGMPRNMTLTSSWVPTVTGSTSSGGITYTTQVGYYQRVNNLISASFYILLSSKGTATGTVQISSFPIANNSTSQSARCSVLFTDGTLTANYTHLYGELASSATDLLLTEVGSAVQQPYDFSNAMNTSSFSGTVIYEVD